MYRIATTTEYVFNNKCLTYDEAVEVKNNLEKENPTCRLFIYKEQFIVYCNEAMCDKILLYNDEIEECNELYHFDGKRWLNTSSQTRKTTIVILPITIVPTKFSTQKKMQSLSLRAN